MMDDDAFWMALEKLEADYVADRDKERLFAGLQRICVDDKNAKEVMIDVLDAAQSTIDLVDNPRYYVGA